MERMILKVNIATQKSFTSKSMPHPKRSIEDKLLLIFGQQAAKKKQKGLKPPR